jgi:hypothetical protein
LAVDDRGDEGDDSENEERGHERCGNGAAETWPAKSALYTMMIS